MDFNEARLATDQELATAQQSPAVINEQLDRSAKLHRMMRQTSQPSDPVSIFPLVAAVVVAVPLWLAVTLLRSLGEGTAWLARESWLASFFAAPGDSLARYVIGTGTLVLLLPGALVLLATWLRDTRLRWLGVWVLVPAALLLVVLLLVVTQGTFTENVVRVAP